MRTMGIEQGTATQAPVAPVVPPLPQSAGAPTGANPTAPATTPQVTITQPTPEAIVIQQPPYRNQDNEIPPEVIPIIGMLSGTLMAIILGYPIIRFVTRMIERRTDRSMLKASEVTAQLRALQESVDTMAIELERISEAQRFSAKLLAERSERR